MDGRECISNQINDKVFRHFRIVRTHVDGKLSSASNVGLQACSLNLTVPLTRRAHLAGLTGALSEENRLGVANHAIGYTSARATTGQSARGTGRETVSRIDDFFIGRAHEIRALASRTGIGQQSICLSSR